MTHGVGRVSSFLCATLLFLVFAVNFGQPSEMVSHVSRDAHLLHEDDLIRDLWSSRSSQFSFPTVGGAGASQWPQGVCPAYAYTTRRSRGRICMVVVEDIQISRRLGYSRAYHDWKMKRMPLGLNLQ